MTKSKIYYVTSLIILGICAVFSGTIIGISIFLLYLLFPVVQFGLLYLGKWSLRCTLTGKKMASREEPVDMTFLLESTCFWPLPRVELLLELNNLLTGEQMQSRCTAALPSKGKNTVRWQIKSSYCGVIQIQVKKIRVYDWMGIFCRTKENEVREQISILPDLFSPYVEISEALAENMESVRYSEHKKGTDASEIFGIREYTPGDSLKHIHWKLSGKMDELYVKELSLPVENSILLLFENCRERGIAVAPEWTAGLAEIFFSISQALAEQGIHHTLGWHNHQSMTFASMEVENTDDLADAIGGILTVGCQESTCNTVFSYLNEPEAGEYSHVVYVAPEACRELELLKDSCVLTVIAAKGSPEVQSFTPATMAEDLAYISI